MRNRNLDSDPSRPMSGSIGNMNLSDFEDGRTSTRPSERSTPGDYRPSHQKDFMNRPGREDHHPHHEGIMEKIGRFFGVGPKNYRRSDERIKEEVNESLWRHHDIDASDIEVDVADGVVILLGTVDSRMTKRLAEDCVLEVVGVTDVTNNLKVKSTIQNKPSYNPSMTTGMGMGSNSGLTNTADPGDGTGMGMAGSPTGNTTPSGSYSSGVPGAKSNSGQKSH